MAEFEALFLPDGDGWMPTAASLGPWGADLLHGGAVSALAIALMEDEADDDYESVRYSADFIRALPLRKLDADARTIEVLVDDSVLAARRTEWKLPEPRYTTGVLAKFARLVTGADRGAITEP